MTLVGYKRLTIRILDGEQAELDKNMFVIEGKKGKGATLKADIKGLSPEALKVYGSNIAYFTVRKGVGNVEVDTETMDLPFNVQKAILGHKTKDGITYIGEDTEPPMCSMLLESETLAGEKALYGLFCGSFSSDEVNMETREEKPKDPAADKTTFTALASEQEDNSKGQSVGYYIGKEESEITKLKTQLNMIPAG